MNLFTKIKSYFQNKAMSISQAMNYTKAMQEPGVLEKEAQENAKDMPITNANYHNRKEYLQYCINLCPYHKYRIVLTLLKIHGMSYGDIARHLQKSGFGTTTDKDIMQVEKDGLKYVREAIARIKDKGIPILEGKITGVAN